MPSTPFVTYTPSAGASLRELLADIEAGPARMKQAGASRVLVDMTGVDPQPGEVETLLISHHAGWHLPGLDRVAVVVKVRTGQGERVAQHLRTNLLVFTSTEDARAWLAE